MPPHIIPICVEVPADFEPRARYAVEMLLLPLNIVPRWSDRDEVVRASGIYYGERPPDEIALTLGYSRRAAAFYRAKKAIEVVHWQDLGGERVPVLFVGDAEAPDVVASAFYFLSGWQEVVTTARDEHGRFRYEDSLQSQFDIADLPVVDAYRQYLAKRLRVAGIEHRRLRWGEKQWAFCPTFDVDYLRKWRPGMVYREVAQYFIANRRRVGAAERFRRFGAFVRDYFRVGDTYREAIERLAVETRKVGGTGTFFLKTDAHGPNDVGYDLEGRHGRRLTGMLRQKGFELGLHPSYFADRHDGYLHAELERFERATGTRPSAVRQHYLRYSVPWTGRLHEDAGLKVDSTLGFAVHEGFRNGTCMPFRVYDPLADRPLEVWEMPLALMDGTLFNRRGLDAREAVDATIRLMERVRGFGGVAVMLWHNVLWDPLDAPGWEATFLAALKEASEGDALIASLSESLREWLPTVDASG